MNLLAKASAATGIAHRRVHPSPLELPARGRPERLHCRDSAPVLQSGHA